VVPDLVHGGIGEHHQRVAMILSDGAECRFEFTEIAGRKNARRIGEIRKLDAEFPGCLLGGLPLEVLAGVLRPGEDRNSSRLRQPLLDELNAFADELYGQVAHAGEIAAGPGPALHKLDVERIAAESEHHRLCRLERAERQDRELLRDDDLGIGCEELACRSFHVVQSRCPKQANRQIAAFAPPQLAQTRTQGIQIRRGLVRAPGAEPRNAPYTLALLRARRERPRNRRAGQQRDELASSQLIELHLMPRSGERTKEYRSGRDQLAGMPGTLQPAS
jgi:hypothetical protein